MPAPRGRAGWRSRADHRLSPYLFVAPFFVLFAVFGLWPLGYTFWVSLHDWELIGGDPTFTGLANYRDLLADDWFWNATLNTFAMFALATGPQLLLALVLAHLLNRRLRGRTLFRMGFLVPNVTSVVAVALVFSMIFGRDYGLANYLLGVVGVDTVDWRAERWTAWLAIAAMVDWRWTGWNTLIYLAAMQAIPKDLYESAALDGASQWRQFWRITVPLLRPTILFTVVISTIGGVQLFTEPLLFDNQPGSTSGGTLRQFQTLSLYMYERAFRRFEYGYGSAIAWVIFLIIAVAAAANYLLVRRLTRGSAGQP